MYRNLLTAFILLHVLGDFYFQTDSLSEKKRSSYRAVVLHSVIYAAVLIAGTLAYFSLQVAIAVSALSLMHFAIDSAKYRLVKSRRIGPESLVYAVDQCLHILLYVATTFIFIYNHFPIALFPKAGQVLSALGLNGTALLNWAAIVLVIGKPINITIKKLLSEYRPDDKGEADERTFRNAGAFIGSLERIIIVLLLSVNQYAAIGLVLTAKSVARYDKISKDQAFAEYYLLGTLLSTLSVILAHLAFR